MRAWWIAAIIAFVTNVGVVIVLSQISNLHVPLPEAPPTVRTIRQVEPESLPPPSPREAPPEPMTEPLAIALPTLDLPTTPNPDALALPDIPNLDATFDLPLTVPGFTTIAATTTPGDDPGSLTLGEPDQPAELQGAFDLERFYPRAARLRGVQGRSRLRLTINEKGVVTNVAVFEATPAGVFDRATEELGRNLSFTPARREGKPVPSTKDLIIDWTLK
jgi:protein TonB